MITRGSRRNAQAGAGSLSLEVIGQLARRLARLEEVLEAYREGAPPDRRGFDGLQRRLADHGIEHEMEEGGEAEAEAAAGGDGADEEED